MLVCFATIVFDGYDLVVYGTTVPAILADQQWDVSPAQAGAIGSYALIGMLIGALAIGALTDIVGHRRVMLLCITWFSIAMALTWLAPNPQAFGLLRFVAGLGLGGVVPTAIALTVEYSRPERRQFNNAVMYSGYSVGGIGAAVLGLALLPQHDFRLLYLFGALPLVVILPIAWKWLPESTAYLVSRGRLREARALADRYGLQVPALQAAAGHLAPPSSRSNGLRVLFSRQYLASTLLFAAASFCGLLLVYGLNTWLPRIMQQAGFGLGSSLSFLLVLNVGAVIGAIGASFVADRVGIRPVTIAAFGCAAAAVVLLAAHQPTAAVFLLVALAGLGSVGTQILVNGYVATTYPDDVRATALGWALGIGRLGAITGPIAGGLIAGNGLGYQWNFYLFAVVAMAGLLLIAAVPAQRRRAARTSRSRSIPFARPAQ
ncbi:aromatic acid/H+ symport family MFS transporter [Nakamurella flava]|uniref:Aromatic acid/H+ symport family MFS transporter n=1 Tax=Nakamurella flava TaxID=2576308 RepID=A0A4U6QNK5_9ACTN|nr:aromatic acid/H+ symport family MFS transporter [Nakamurella flava]